MAAFTQMAKPFVGTTAPLATRHQVVRPRAPCPAPRAAARGLWLPDTEPPKHLDGTLPGDRGFDPLGLGTDADRLKWYAEAEKQNGRWAMLGVAGILGQELLGVQPKWFEAGAKDYGIPPITLVGLEALLFGFIELKRLQGFKKTGGIFALPMAGTIWWGSITRDGRGFQEYVRRLSVLEYKSGFLDFYPFDPVGLNSEANATKEIKNGRLAMVAFVGFAVQALLTREGPIEGLFAHLSDPFGHNIATNLLNIQNVIGK